VVVEKNVRITERFLTTAINQAHSDAAKGEKTFEPLNAEP
jgi:hypothetical protein